METHITDQLQEIFGSMGLVFNLASCAIVATDLSKVVNKQPHWSAKYVNSIYKGSLKPSKKFINAVQMLGERMDSAIPGIEGAQPSTIMAIDLPENVFLPRSYQVAKCARSGCPVHFVKLHHFQKYHDPECRPKK